MNGADGAAPAAKAGLKEIGEGRRDPARILRDLIRFDTTNPPGNESACVRYLASLLAEAGIEGELIGRDEGRLNLVARLRGRGEAPPLLLYGHADVVPASPAEWRFPPFAGELAEGCVWGRGALDMKGAVAMMAAALLAAAATGRRPAGDVILAFVADEEDGGAFGARHLVETRPELFAGAKHAIGEIGGFTLRLGGREFYPIMVAEKQRCGVRATFRGQSGHGSMPARGSAAAKLGAALAALDRRRLPVHATEPARLMIEALAKGLGGPQGLLLRALLKPSLADGVLGLMGGAGRFFDPVLHNTVNATILRAGGKINVVPGEAMVDFDARILPGFGVEDLLSELRAALSDGKAGRGRRGAPGGAEEPELEVLFFDEGPAAPDLGLFGLLSEILREAVPGGLPVPFMVSGVTDARFFSRLGIQTYGFTPMRLPPEIDFSRLIHGVDERVPAEALGFGSRAMGELLARYRG